MIKIPLCLKYACTDEEILVKAESCAIPDTCGFVLTPCSVDECRNIILQYGVREVTASQVARVLGMMARTHSGLSDGIPLQVHMASWWLLLF